MAGARGLTEEEANKGIMTRREVGKETAGDGWGYWSDTSDHRDDRQRVSDRGQPIRLAGPRCPGGPVLRGSWPRRQPAAVNHRALFPPRPPALLERRTSNINQPDPQTEPGGTPLTAASSRPQGEIKPMACNMDTRKSLAFRVKISYKVEGEDDLPCHQLLEKLSWRFHVS